MPWWFYQVFIGLVGHKWDRMIHALPVGKQTSLLRTLFKLLQNIS